MRPRCVGTVCGELRGVRAGLSVGPMCGWWMGVSVVCWEMCVCGYVGGIIVWRETCGWDDLGVGRLSCAGGWGYVWKCGAQFGEMARQRWCGEII